MDLLNRIEVDPKIMMGKPIIKGTRITVETILRKFSEGMSQDHILEAYPALEKSDIIAAFQYAHAVVANEEIIFPKAS